MAIVILFLCSRYISSAIGDTDYYILGGNNANIQNFPYQISIQVNATMHRCGGSLVTEKFIITAAHCFLLDPIHQLYIAVGSSKLFDKSQIYPIEHAIPHALYNTKEKLHDIAIIGVKNKIIFNKFVKPIKILRNNFHVGTKLTATGWGYTSYPTVVTPDKLQELQVHMISLTECQKAFKLMGDNEPIEDTLICTLEKINKGICMGDSGGPLTLKGFLVGVASRVADSGCGTGKPDIFTRVSRYIKWIKTTITTYCKTRTCPKKKLYPKFVRIKEMF